MINLQFSSMARIPGILENCPDSYRDEFEN